MCKRLSEVVANTNLTLAPIGESPMAEILFKKYVKIYKIISYNILQTNLEMRKV